MSFNFSERKVNWFIMKTKTSPPIKRVQNAPLSLTNLHDSELVRRYIHGDEACLEVLLNRHKGLVFGNIFKIEVEMFFE